MRHTEASTAKYEASIIRPNPDVSAVGPSLSLNATHSGNYTGRIGSTDPGKAGPIDLRRRHRPAQHAERVRTGPWGSRSAAARMNARRRAGRRQPPLPSRIVSTASSMSRRGRALVLRAACSAPQDRLTTPTCGSGCRLRDKGRSKREPRGCALPDIPPRRAAAEIVPGSIGGIALLLDNAKLALDQLKALVFPFKFTTQAFGKRPALGGGSACRNQFECAAASARSPECLGRRVAP
jgi:hypothetical protein